MPKHKLSANNEAILQKLAGQLPQPKHTGKVTKTGRELLDDNPNAKTKAGKPVDPKTEYPIIYPPAINHYRRLRKAFEAGGQHGVEKYLSQYGKVEQPVKEQG